MAVPYLRTRPTRIAAVGSCYGLISAHCLLILLLLCCRLIRGCSAAAQFQRQNSMAVALSSRLIPLCSPATVVGDVDRVLDL